jgi:hypothetical protein
MGHRLARKKVWFMKPKDPQKLKLWLEAEKALTVPQRPEVLPEILRTSGLVSIERQAWPATLLRLEEAVQYGVRDLQTLDALGEAAYQTKTYQALIPFEELYRDPLVAIHMARAYMMLGMVVKAREFLRFSQDTLLKAAVEAVLGVENDIETAAKAILAPTSRPDIENLNLIEYWQALAPIAEAIGRQDLVQLAELKSKALAYAKPVIHYNQALRLLAAGEFRAGWKLHDWRLAPGSPCTAPTSFADFSMWEGEALENKRILVILENGFGDQIFGLRYVKALAEEHPSHIDVAVGPELSTLVKTSFPEVTVHNLSAAQDVGYWQDKARPDYWTYCLSVPSRSDFWRPLYTEGFLKTPQDLMKEYTQQIRTQNPRKLPVHGLVWHGDIRTVPMRTRAYSVSEFLQESQILNEPRMIVCLQKDATEEEIKTLESAVKKSGGLFINAASTLNDFSHTAAWISSLDKMWSCDTATAHLGGALGKPTTVLIRNKAIWHWLQNPQTKAAVWYNSCQVQYALTPKFSFMFEIRPALEAEKSL